MLKVEGFVMIAWTGLCAGMVTAEPAAGSALAQTYGALEADRVELARIADYQTELLKLAQDDLEGALAARRSLGNCAQRRAVVALCDHLSASFTGGVDD